MAWPYHLIELGDEQRLQRRELLDRYGLYAQLSALIPILGYQLYRLGAWVYTERLKSKITCSEVPASLSLKRQSHKTSGVVQTWRSMLWWLEDEVAPGWGLIGNWIAAGCWVSWLFFLCIHKTGDDYLHITKRFGHIAAAQFPVHYMLSMRSVGSPLAFIFRSSHEQLNPWHQLSGRIIYFLLLNHAGWYINYFIQTGIFYQRLTDPVVIIGLTGFCLLTVVATTSLDIVRCWSYRVFYTFHLTIGLWLLPLLFFHARPLRFYVSEAIALFLINKVIQNLDTIQSLAIIAPVPHTSLLTIKVPIPASKLPRFEAAPGQHVYLFIPPESRANKSSQAIHDFLFNPFTVVDISPTNITLVLRTLHGPTTKTLETLATLPQPKSIKLEGPYGSSRFFPNFAEKYDRILLVAGGMGATFILPIYRAIHQQLETESKNSNQLTFHWSIRSAEEASWAINDLKKATVLKNDENVKIYITGSKTDDQLDNIEWAEQQIKANESRERPDLREIVDEIFRAGKGEKVAVLVCGPEGMARELRANVGRWVHRGREVWWHDERFGW